MSRRILIAVFVSAFIAALFAYSHPAKAQVVPDGLIAYWTFDDISGDTVPDSAGDFDGTIMEGAPKQVPGKVGKALDFDGTAYIDTGAEISQLGAESFTFALWLKTANVSNPLMSKCNGDGTWACPNEKQLYIADPPTSEGPNKGPVEYVGCANDWIRGSIPVDDDEWHHVAMTWDIDAREGFVYTDGEEGTFEVGFNGGADNPGETVRVAFAAGFHSTGFYIGLMDDFRIYNRALDPDEVLEIMEEKAAVRPAGKLAITWGMIK